MTLFRRSLLGVPFLLAAAPAPAPRLPLAAVPIARLETPWWRARHAEKLAELQRGRYDLVFLGDSITQQWETSGPPPAGDYRSVWQQYYGDRHALNLGFSGDATSHLLWRMRNGELDGLTPKVAVILIGANNLGRVHWPANETVIGIDTVVAEARRKLPGAKLLLLAVLPSERSEWASQTTIAINRALAARYGHGAVAGVTYLDVGGVFMPNGVLDRGLYSDPTMRPPEPPLHPSVEGQGRMAAAMEPILAGMLGDRDHRRR